MSKPWKRNARPLACLPLGTRAPESFPGGDLQSTRRTRKDARRSCCAAPLFGHRTTVGQGLLRLSFVRRTCVCSRMLVELRSVDGENLSPLLPLSGPMGKAAGRGWAGQSGQGTQNFFEVGRLGSFGSSTYVRTLMTATAGCP